jgi:hypothetical protein
MKTYALTLPMEIGEVFHIEEFGRSKRAEVVGWNVSNAGVYPICIISTLEKHDQTPMRVAMVDYEQMVNAHKRQYLEGFANVGLSGLEFHT